MKLNYNTRYPAVEDLRRRAKARIPRFAFDYLDGGCNEDVNLHRNTADIREIELRPYYLSPYAGSDLKTTLFGQEYDAPFGVSPLGLQGLIWPNAPEILARAAFRHNIPFILSTVSTSSIERIGEITGGRAWFQLYNPAKDDIRNDIFDRLEAAGYPVLVILSDVPTFGYRPREIRNRLAMPPKITLRNMLQVLGKPRWALHTLRYGLPRFATMQRYMPPRMNIQQLGRFMLENFSGRLDEDRVAAIRDRWKGKLVIKGVASAADAEKAVRLGLDGIIVSNHGGRQLDAGQSAVKALQTIAPQFGDQITVMMDSGIRSGPDIARVLASGAQFTFLGRSFMYGVAALGDRGGEHAVYILKLQLQQVLEQICCERVEKLPGFLVNH